MNELKVGDKIKVTGFSCGYTALHRLQAMGIIKDKILEIKSVNPMRGPYVVNVDKNEYTIGRGLFSKIIYEEVE